MVRSDFENCIPEQCMNAWLSSSPQPLSVQGDLSWTKNKHRSCKVDTNSHNEVFGTVDGGGGWKTEKIFCRGSAELISDHHWYLAQELAMSCGITPVCNPSPHWWNMCTAAGRKYRRVQVSVSCQGVHTLPLPLGGGGGGGRVTGSRWMVWRSGILWWLGSIVARNALFLIAPKSNEIQGRYTWRSFLKWCIRIRPPFIMWFLCSQQSLKHNIGRLNRAASSETRNAQDPWIGRGDAAK